ncbi:MAG: FapA family protein [Peptococcaceae bacterium]|jgi:hypothetical protein|nr:FapA family protein [Peptococcaceae bacterium]
MPEQLVQGKSLEDICQEWAEKLQFPVDQLEYEVLEKPGLFNRNWKVIIRWPEGADHEAPGQADAPDIPAAAAQDPICTQVEPSEQGYRLLPGLGLQSVVPDAQAGQLFKNGQEIQLPTQIAAEDQWVFKPACVPGWRNWSWEVREKGFVAVAVVQQQKSRRAILPKEIYSGEVLDIMKCVRWETSEAEGDFWPAARYVEELEKKKITFGCRADAWQEILAVDGEGEVIVAEGVQPVPGQPCVLYDGVNNTTALGSDPDDRTKIDYFASKITLVEKDAVLLRKERGIPGENGYDVFGHEIKPKPVHDIPLTAKNNVRLSEDGLSLIAECSGRPVRVDKSGYAVEAVYTLNHDVDLSTGSIDFPGNVMVKGNVQEGMHIFSDGSVDIRGAAAHAEIRGDRGVKVSQTVHGGKLLVGYHSVVRLELGKRLTELLHQVQKTLKDMRDLLISAQESGFKPGQCLKLILEKRYPHLPKLAADTDAYLTQNAGSLVSEELASVVRVIKQSLTGLEPVKDTSVMHLNQACENLAQMIAQMAEESKEEVCCEVSYIQGATVESSGGFLCEKAVYNCTIQAEGDVLIKGVCRGGKIISGGNVTIGELGGSGVSSTFVQIGGDKRLKTEYCHPNVIIAVNKEIVKIEEAYRKLEIYRAGGVVQVDKLLVRDQE